MTDAHAERFLAHMKERFAKNGHAVAKALRDMADEVDREVDAPPNKVNAPAHAWKAHRVVHIVTWGVANLNLNALVLDAAETDILSKEQQ